ncbi:MAG: TRAP transporter substrate-binding protein DctP, partial [Polyangiales bacterium]
FWLLGLVMLGMPLAHPSALAQAPKGKQAKSVEVIRLVTLGPRSTPWWRVFQSWKTSLRQDSDGALKLDVRPGTAAGDEKAVVRKLKASRIDAATLSVTGLAMLVPEAAVLQAPGLVDDYARYDKVRAALRAELEAAFAQRGYVVLGWGHLGRARLMSTKAIPHPAALAQAKSLTWPGDPVFHHVLAQAGAKKVARIPLSKVRQALEQGRIEVAPASALAALYLGWQPHLKYVSKQSNAVLVSATVMRKARFDALRAAAGSKATQALTSTGAKAHRLMRKLVAKRDEAAYRELRKAGLKSMDLGAQRRAWQKLADATSQRIAKQAGLFDKAWLKKAKDAAQ